MGESDLQSEYQGGDTLDLPTGLSRSRDGMRRTKEAVVADYLRERIVTGVLAPGTKLKQAEIAAQLELSITPVREAMKLLEAQGYISSTSHKGAVVAVAEPVHVSELASLRALLEPRLVRMALPLLTQSVLDELEELQSGIQAAVAAGDVATARRLDYRFHFLLYGLADQPQTLHFVGMLWAVFPFKALTQAPGRLEASMNEHDLILAELRADDPREAPRMMQRHIEAGWRAFLGRGRSRNV